MPFGNEKDQTKCSPKDNNYCGGFALDAVLTDLKISTPPNPEGTYKEIQHQQKIKLVSSSVSNYFIENTIKNGTAMSLPSSIALTAKSKYSLNVSVHIDEKKLGTELEEGGTALIKEEKVKLPGVVQNSTKLVADAEKSGASHFIVLVNYAHHWVAVKKESNNKYICYDPGTGRCVTESTLSEAVGVKRMNSLIITLK